MATMQTDAQKPNTLLQVLDRLLREADEYEALTKEFDRVCRSLRAGLRAHGWRVSRARRSPRSESRYYEAWHPDGVRLWTHEIRVSLHRLPGREDSAQGIVVGPDSTENNAEVRDWINELNAEELVGPYRDQR